MINIKDNIKDSIKYANYENIPNGKITISKIELTKTKNDNDILRFIGNVKNSKGDLQETTISKRYDEEDDESIKWVVDLLVKAFMEQKITDGYQHIESLNELVAFANSVLVGKVFNYITVNTKTRDNVIIKNKELEFTFNK